MLVDAPIELISTLLACSIRKDHQNISIYLLISIETVHLLRMDHIPAPSLSEISVLFLFHPKQYLPPHGHSQSSTLNTFDTTHLSERCVTPFVS